MMHATSAAVEREIVRKRGGDRGRHVYIYIYKYTTKRERDRKRERKKKVTKAEETNMARSV